MVELYARALQGQRAYGPPIVMIGAMILAAGFIAGFSFKGSPNGEMFLWYVEQVFVPHLRPGAVVVMEIFLPITLLGWLRRLNEWEHE